MSTFNDIDIECPDCQEAFRGTVWVGIHAGIDPELKDLLLGGELNLVSCPHCGQVSFYEHFLIYQEPAAELVAYVYPEAQLLQEEELKKVMLEGFREAQKELPEKARLSYDPVLVFGLESLIELLQREEALGEQSQVAQALCKENNIDTVFLRPAQARRLQTMRVIPHTGKGKKPNREEVLRGIDRLLEIDPVLDLYGQLRESIKADDKWQIT